MSLSSGSGQDRAKRWNADEQSVLCTVVLMNALPIARDIELCDRMKQVPKITSHFSNGSQTPNDVKGRIQKTFTQKRNVEVPEFLFNTTATANRDNSACLRLAQRIVERPGTIGDQNKVPTRSEAHVKKRKKAFQEALGKRNYSLAELSQELDTYTPSDLLLGWTS